MRDFAEKELKPLGHQVTIIEGDKPQPHHFAGLVEALKDADLLVLFSRRRFPPKDQMAAIRAHLDAGKPLLGIRTANHAFIPKPKEVVDPSLAAMARIHRRSPRRSEHRLRDERPALHRQRSRWCQNTAARRCERGRHPRPSIALQSAAARRQRHAHPHRHASSRSPTPPQPVAWTRSYGANKARIFYTSLGAPEDMLIADVRRLLVNAVKWTLEK
jgi:hypothetical protein